VCHAIIAVHVPECLLCCASQAATGGGAQREHVQKDAEVRPEVTHDV